jgi:hypothetical protein
MCLLRHLSRRYGISDPYNELLLIVCKISHVYAGCRNTWASWMYEWVHKCSADCDVHVTVHRVKFLIIKLIRCTDFSNLFLEWNSTCFGRFLCPSSGVFHCTHSNGICHTGLLTACEQDQDETANFWNLFLKWNSTCFGLFLCTSSGVFHCTHSNGICHTGLLTACEQDQDATANFWNLFLKWNSTCFGQFLCPSSGVFHYTRQWYMWYRFADSLRAGSGWNC